MNGFLEGLLNVAAFVVLLGIGMVIAEVLYRLANRIRK